MTTSGATEMPTDLQCGSAISTDCEGATIPMNEAGFQLLVSEAVSIISVMLTVAIQSAGSSMTENQLKAVNAAGCAVTNLGDNFWNWLAALYYAAKEFGKDAEIEALLEEYYPYVCTCKSEVDLFGAALGGDATTASVTAGCSEAAQEYNASGAA